VRNLFPGDRGNEVTDIQTRLHAQGHDLGSEGVDSLFGPCTEAAVKAFQGERGLLIDGIVGPNTWRELVEAGYALGDRLLYLRVPNFRGDDVLDLQVQLNLLGFNAGPERGICGESVEAAILDFQRNAGLLPDGIVGERTLRTLRALRKAEAGREGKKIPERDKGFVSATSLDGCTVVVDPGHGGTETGLVSEIGLEEKELMMAAALRFGERLREAGCTVAFTREDDRDVGLYERCETANTARAEFFISLHLNRSSDPGAGGAVCYFFQRGHYFSEHGQRLADSFGERLAELCGGYLGSFGRNYALLREPQGIAVLVEPFFMTNPSEAARAREADYVDRLALALIGGLRDYVDRKEIA